MKYLAQLFFIPVIIIQSSMVIAQSCGSDSLILLSETPSSNLFEFPQTIVADRLSRPYFYVAAKDSGLRIYGAANLQSPVLLKTIRTTSFDSLHVMNAVQEGNYLYLALGDFFGSNTQKYGMAIVNITDPANPSVTDFWEIDSVKKGSGIVIVDGNYAYLGAMTAGLVILNISDKNKIAFVSHFIPNKNFPNNNPSPSQTPNARGMAIQGNNLFLCNDAGGLWAIDVSDKLHPQERSHYINSVMLGKQQAYNNIVIHNNLAYIGVDYCGMEIVDISDPDNIKQKGWWNPWSCQSPSNFWLNSQGHVNQVVYDSTRQIVLLSSGDSELRMIDVSDPAHPDSCNGYGIYGNKEGVWGVDEFEGKIYLSYIFAAIPFSSNWSGIKILDWKINTGISAENNLNQFSFSPNPFNEEMEIHFSITHGEKISFSVYNVLGENIENICNEYFPSGNHQIKWNGAKLIPGIYFIQMKTANNSDTRKAIKTE